YLTRKTCYSLAVARQLILVEVRTRRLSIQNLTTMSISELKALSTIDGCQSNYCNNCRCRLQTLVKLRDFSYDSTTSSFISNSISNSPSNLSLTESALESAFCKFCDQSSDHHLLQAAALTNPMVESRAATISAYRLLNSEENWSNSNCEFDSDSNARLNIRNSSSSTRSEHSSEQVAKAYREADQPLLTLDFGLQNSVKASVRVASPVEATHCSRSASPCGGCSRTSGSDSGSPVRKSPELPVEMEMFGPYDGDYNSAESQTRLERSYNIKLQPAVRLHRTIADPLPGQLDMRQVRHNFKLVKLRQHPMQLDAEGRRLEDVGVSRLDHILNRRLVQLHKNSLIKDGGKRPDSELSTSAAYPEWLSFQLRIMKTFAATRWMLFVAQRKKLRSSEPDNIERRANVRESHKYNPKYIDVWSTSVSVSVKDGSLLRDAIDPAFARMGLDKRSDFRYSVGCFLGDKRQSGPNSSQLIVPVEVFPSTPVRDLYRMNASEIFLNDNKLILFDGLPESVHGYPGWGKDFRKEEPKPAVKKKGCCSCR
ncbi:hypothetical protein BOX15_Mlig017453g1, partial [Macrostomum lignano]